MNFFTEILDLDFPRATDHFSGHYLLPRLQHIITKFGINSGSAPVCKSCVLIVTSGDAKITERWELLIGNRYNWAMMRLPDTAIPYCNLLH